MNASRVKACKWNGSDIQVEQGKKRNGYGQQEGRGYGKEIERN